MSEVKNPGIQQLLDALKKVQDAQGPSMVLGRVSDSKTIQGLDPDGKTIQYGFPLLKISRRTMADSPVAIWFEKDKEPGKVRMRCDFESAATEGMPLKLAEVTLYLKNFEDQENPMYRKIDLMYSATPPQQFNGNATFSLEEFVYLKESFAKGILGFHWSGIIPYYDVSDPTTVERLKSKEGERPAPFSASASGDVGPVFIEDFNQSAYRNVMDLLCWQHEVIGDEKNEVWFKDTMTNNTYHFLPQVYWIKADAMTNAPKMSIAMKAGDDPDDFSSYRIVVGFDIGPYFHPRAERDLYRIIKQRSSGKFKYCLFSYGGYDSSYFQWDPEFENGILHDLGIKALVNKKILETAPDSSFSVALESPLDSWKILRDKLAGESLYIGNVVLETKEGLDEKPRQIPIKVELDLRKLTQSRVSVEILESDEKKINFPYQAQIRNDGQYPIEIGGCEMSFYSDKKDVVRDAAHGLQNTTKWPISLEPGASETVTLKPEYIKELQKKNQFLGFIPKKYWTNLVCEPYSIRLIDNDIAHILADYEDLATNDPSIWKLKVDIMDWESVPNLLKLDFEIKSKYGNNSSVTFSNSKTSEEIIMAKNLTAVLSTMANEDGKQYEFRLRAIYNGEVGSWTPWQSGNDDSNTLYLFLSKYSL